MCGKRLAATAINPLQMRYQILLATLKADPIQTEVMTSAEGKLNPSATRYLEWTIRIACMETTPRRITTSMVLPNCVFSVRLKQAMPREKAVMGICLSISKSNVVSGRLLICLEVKIILIMCNLLVYDYPI